MRAEVTVSATSRRWARRTVARCLDNVRCKRRPVSDEKPHVSFPFAGTTKIMALPGFEPNGSQPFMLTTTL